MPGSQTRSATHMPVTFVWNRRSSHSVDIRIWPMRSRAGSIASTGS